MDEGRRDQDAGAEVLAEEDGVAVSTALGGSTGEERETAGDGAEKKDQEQGEDVEGSIVGASLPRPARWSLLAIASSGPILSLRELG